MVALAVFLLILLAAVFAPLLVPHDPNEINLRNRLSSPIWQTEGTGEHILGTDQTGRDVLSRVIWGARTALIISVSSVLLAMVIGTTLGLFAGYFRGNLDAAIMTLVDIWMSFPLILLALAVIAALGPSIPNLILVIGITTWVDYARVIRGEVLILRELDYVQAARASGVSDLRIMVKHLLPNATPSIIVLSTLGLARVILTESSLSFLGLGVPPEIPGWGLMLREAQQYIYRAWWLGIFPGLGILFTVLAINLVGDRLRDVLDPRLD